MATLHTRDPDRSRVPAVPGADAPRAGASVLRPRRQGPAPRRESACLLLVAAVRRRGLRARSDDARSAFVRAERAGLLDVRRKRLHGATGAGPVRRRADRPAVLLATRARACRRYRR